MRECGVLADGGGGRRAPSAGALDSPQRHRIDSNSFHRAVGGYARAVGKPPLVRQLTSDPLGLGRAAQSKRSEQLAPLERLSVFKAGFQSAADPKYVVAPQRGRIAAGESRGASRRHSRA